jgi:hypothetical protein
MKIYQIKITKIQTVKDTFDGVVHLQEGQIIIGRECRYAELTGDEPPHLKPRGDGFFVGDPDKVGFFVHKDDCVVLRAWEIQ